MRWFSKCRWKKVSSPIPIQSKDLKFMHAPGSPGGFVRTQITGFTLWLFWEFELLTSSYVMPMLLAQELHPELDQCILTLLKAKKIEVIGYCENKTHKKNKRTNWRLSSNLLRVLMSRVLDVTFRSTVDKEKHKSRESSGDSSCTCGRHEEPGWCYSGISQQWRAWVFYTESPSKGQRPSFALNWKLPVSR